MKLKVILIYDSLPSSSATWLCPSEIDGFAIDGCVEMDGFSNGAEASCPKTPTDGQTCRKYLPIFPLHNEEKLELNLLVIYLHMHTILYHSLIRGVLKQSCSAGVKNFTNYVFCHPQFSGVIQNLTLIVYANYY